MIKFKFAQKITDPQSGSVYYMCMACKIKLPDHISALKHFANGGSAEHVKALEILRQKLDSTIQSVKDKISTSQPDLSKDLH